MQNFTKFLARIVTTIAIMNLLTIQVIVKMKSSSEDSQATASNQNNNLWAEIQQDPELFIFQESAGVKFVTSNFMVQMLVDLSFSVEFLAFLMEQTNSYTELKNVK